VRILLGTTEGSGFGSTCGLVWRISGYGHEDGLVSRLRLSMGAGSLSRSPENRWRDSFGDGSKVNSVVEGSLRSKIRTGSESGQEAL
jgi:hypothetical protein